jgi:hypothetical protein
VQEHAPAVQAADQRGVQRVAERHDRGDAQQRDQLLVVGDAREYGRDREQTERERHAESELQRERLAEPRGRERVVFAHTLRDRLDGRRDQHVVDHAGDAHHERVLAERRGRAEQAWQAHLHDEARQDEIQLRERDEGEAPAGPGSRGHEGPVVACPAMGVKLARVPRGLWGLGAGDAAHPDAGGKRLLTLTGSWLRWAAVEG